MNSKGQVLLEYIFVLVISASIFYNLYSVYGPDLSQELEKILDFDHSEGAFKSFRIPGS